MKVTTDHPINNKPSHELAAPSTAFQSYLAIHGLPTENVIANYDERTVVGGNLPQFLASLSEEEKRDARYLSKFVGATAVGLFDAALNYLWNEVVLNLRKKVEIYGVDLFFDAAIGSSARASYRDKSDLPGLKDRVLLDTCRKVELISDIVYRKIEHILTMRNQVAASHPNVGAIGGYELLGWLQTCVRDVLQDPLSESAIRITRLVNNLRQRTDLLDDQTISRIEEQVQHLSTPHIQNLTLTLFGIACAPTTSTIHRTNTLKIAPFVWNSAPDGIKYRVGATIDGYRTNLEQDRLSNGIDFLKIVNGLRYESVPARTVALTHLAIELRDTHARRDNFWNEPPVMQRILDYIEQPEDVPQAVLDGLTTVVVQCRIGNGYDYCQGVSPRGSEMYETYLRLLTEEGAVSVLRALMSPEVSYLLRKPVCQPHVLRVLEIVRKRVVHDRLREAFDYLIGRNPGFSDALNDRGFTELIAPYVSFGAKT